MTRTPILSIIPVLLLWSCGIAHPLVIVQKNTLGGVTVHAEFLGEYPSDVGVIEVTDLSTGHAVWRVKPVGDMFQIHSFDLRAGSNPSALEPSWGRTRTTVPAKGDFALSRGPYYRVSVCSPHRLKRCGTDDFVL